MLFLGSKALRGVVLKVPQQSRNLPELHHACLANRCMTRVAGCGAADAMLAKTMGRELLCSSEDCRAVFALERAATGKTVGRALSLPKRFMVGVKNSCRRFPNRCAEGARGMKGLFSEPVREVVKERASFGAYTGQPFKIIPEHMQPGLGQETVRGPKEIPKSALCKKCAPHANMQVGRQTERLCTHPLQRGGRADPCVCHRAPGDAQDGCNQSARP